MGNVAQGLSAEKQEGVIYNTTYSMWTVSALCRGRKKAQQMFNTLVEQMKQAEGITEQLKEQDQLEWVQKVNNICNRAEESVTYEIVLI